MTKVIYILMQVDHNSWATRDLNLSSSGAYKL